MFTAWPKVLFVAGADDPSNGLWFAAAARFPKTELGGVAVDAARSAMVAVGKNDGATADCPKGDVEVPG